jgi:hypothetical protein
MISPASDKPTADSVKRVIYQAFATARYPGDDKLRGSDEGDEPFAVEREFRGKRDWRSLDAQFIDRSPGGMGSALSFFSNAAFCFYMPAYLIAQIDGALERCDPVFHLTHGFEKDSAQKLINPRRYGNETWHNYRTERCAGFTVEQCAAIVAYLKFMRDADDSDDFIRRQITDALEAYWKPRVV